MPITPPLLNKDRVWYDWLLAPSVSFRKAVWCPLWYTLLLCTMCHAVKSDERIKGSISSGNPFWHLSIFFTPSVHVLTACRCMSWSVSPRDWSSQRPSIRGDCCVSEDSDWQQSYLVDPASSHMLVSKIKPCMSKYKQLYTVKLRTAHYISNNLFDGPLLHG